MLVLTIDPDTVDLNMVVYYADEAAEYVVCKNKDMGVELTRIKNKYPSSGVVVVVETPVDYGAASSNVESMRTQIDFVSTILYRLYNKNKVIIRSYTPQKAKKSVPKHIALNRMQAYLNDSERKLIEQCSKSHPKSIADIQDCIFLYLIYSRRIRPGGVSAAH